MKTLTTCKKCGGKFELDLDSPFRIETMNVSHCKVCIMENVKMNLERTKGSTPMEILGETFKTLV